MILVSVLTVALAAGICTDMFSGRHVLISGWSRSDHWQDVRDWRNKLKLELGWFVSGTGEAKMVWGLWMMVVLSCFIFLSCWSYVLFPFRTRVRRRRTPCERSAFASSAWTSAWERAETDWPELPRCWSSSRGRPPSSPRVGVCLTSANNTTLSLLHSTTRFKGKVRVCMIKDSTNIQHKSAIWTGEGKTKQNLSYWDEMVSEAWVVSIEDCSVAIICILLWKLTCQWPLLDLRTSWQEMVTVVLVWHTGTLVILSPVAGSSRVLLHRKTKFSLSSCGLVLVISCTVIKYA